MAKRNWGKSRRTFMGKYLKGNINENMALDTLAGLAILVGTFDETVNERTLISSIEMIISVTGQTSSDENDGPILVGVAHSDYSAAEIEAVIENLGSWNEGDLVNQETAKRWVRKLTTIQWPVGTDQSFVANDGKPIKAKLNWTLLQGQGLSMFAYNQGTSALLTGSEIFMEGHANLWPK